MLPISVSGVAYHLDDVYVPAIRVSHYNDLYQKPARMYRVFPRSVVEGPYTTIWRAG